MTVYILSLDVSPYIVTDLISRKILKAGFIDHKDACAWLLNDGYNRLYSGRNIDTWVKSNG